MPFVPEPTSASARTTGWPVSAAHSVSRATWRPRSLRWSWDDTRAYEPKRLFWGDEDGIEETRIVRLFTRTAGTGSVPAWNQLSAVCGWMP